MRAHWEQEKKTKNSPAPSSAPPPKNSKEKKISLLRLLLGWINFLFRKQLVTIFNLY
jgi:hypothetical protein